jgi:hypothetical protein
VSVSAFDHTLHLFHRMEDLQGWNDRVRSQLSTASQGWRSIRPKHRQTPVAAQGRVAARPSCAYGVQSGSAPVESAPEEIVECP